MGSAALASTGPVRVVAGHALMTDSRVWSQGIAPSQAPALTAECCPCCRHCGDLELGKLVVPRCKRQLHPEAEASLGLESPVSLPAGLGVTESSSFRLVPGLEHCLRAVPLAPATRHLAGKACSLVPMH